MQQQQQVNVDETSWAKHNKKQWLWTATTPLVTGFLIMARRSTAAAQQLLGQQIIAVIGSDHFSAYNWLNPAQRQLCWAHLLRDF